MIILPKETPPISLQRPPFLLMQTRSFLLGGNLLEERTLSSLRAETASIFRRKYLGFHYRRYYQFRWKKARLYSRTDVDLVPGNAFILGEILGIVLEESTSIRLGYKRQKAAGSSVRKTIDEVGGKTVQKHCRCRKRETVDFLVGGLPLGTVKSLDCCHDVEEELDQTRGNNVLLSVFEMYGFEIFKPEGVMSINYFGILGTNLSTIIVFIIFPSCHLF